MKNKRVLLNVLVFAGLLGYLVLFYAARLPSLEQATGRVFRRVEFFAWLLLPDELLALWCGTPPELALLDRLPVLAIAGAILGGAVGAGWLLMRLCRADRGLTRLEQFVFSAAVGLSAVSTYVLLAGLLGLVRHRWVFALPAALMLAAVAWVWLSSRPKPQKNEKRAKPRTPDSTTSGKQTNGVGQLGPNWLWLAAPFAVVILLGGMLPPVEFDVREYHLQVPKEFFEQGYVGFLPHNVYGNMPMGAEMLSLLAMVIARDWWLGALAGKTVIAAFAPLTALALFAAGRRFFSTAVGVVAAIIYVSTAWIVQVSSLGLVEGAVACYLFLAVYAVVLWQDKKGSRPPSAAEGTRSHNDSSDARRRRSPVLSYVLLAGYLVGAAVSCKYPAVLFVGVPLTLWILFATGRDRAADGPGAARFLRLNWRPLGVFLLAAVAGCGLWFGKNWAWTGNPTYPLLYEVFGDRTGTWTPEKNGQWNRVHRPHDFSAGALAKDLLCVGLTSEWLSPLVVPLAALALLVRTRRRLLLVLAVYVVYVILTWWLLTHRIDRFWIPVLPVTALLAGVGACWSEDRIWRRVLVGLLVLGCVSSFLEVTTVAGGYTRYFASLAALRDDPMRLDPWHAYFNTHARDGRVLMVGDAQVFDLEVPILYSTCFDESLFERLVKDPATAAVRAPGEIRASLQQLRITHVYVHWGEIKRYRSPGNYGFTDFVQPAVFTNLVGQGVLGPLPAIGEHPGRAYRVVGK